MEIDENFKKLCDAAEVAHRGLVDAPQGESFLSEILDFVISNPSHRKVFVQHFFEILNQEWLIPPVVVAYCMRELQWEEIRHECERILSQKEYDERFVQGIRGVLQAYSSFWDGDLWYSRFKN